LRSRPKSFNKLSRLLVEAKSWLLPEASLATSNVYEAALQVNVSWSLVVAPRSCRFIAREVLSAVYSRSRVVIEVTGAWGDSMDGGTIVRTALDGVSSKCVLSRPTCEPTRARRCSFLRRQERS